MYTEKERKEIRKTLKKAKKGNPFKFLGFGKK